MILALALASAATCLRVPNPPAEVSQGAPPYMEACNIVPHGWRPMSTAPKDGTIVEVRNAWGLLPTYGLFHWAPLVPDAATPEMTWVEVRPYEPPPRPAIFTHGKDKLGEWWASSGGSMTVYMDTTSALGHAWRPLVGPPQKWKPHNPTPAQWRVAVRARYRPRLQHHQHTPTVTITGHSS